MSIDWWTLGLQTINITVLVWLLAHFLFRPVAAIIAERKAFAGRLLDEAEEAKTAACGMREQADGALREIAANRAAAIHAAAEEAQTEKSAMLSTAQSEIERLRASADAELAHARKAERRAESERARRLAIDIAAKLLNRLPEGARVAGFVEGLAQAVATLPPETRADFGEGALLKVPRPLTAEEDEFVPPRARERFRTSARSANRSRPRVDSGSRTRKPARLRAQQFPRRSRADRNRVRKT